MAKDIKHKEFVKTLTNVDYLRIEFYKNKGKNC